MLLGDYGNPVTFINMSLTMVIHLFFLLVQAHFTTSIENSTVTTREKWRYTTLVLLLPVAKITCGIILNKETVLIHLDSQNLTTKMSFVALLGVNNATKFILASQKVRHNKTCKGARMAECYQQVLETVPTKENVDIFLGALELGPEENGGYFALLRLEEKIPYTEQVGKTNLVFDVDETYRDVKNCSTAGWGYNNLNGTPNGAYLGVARMHCDFEAVLQEKYDEDGKMLKCRVVGKGRFFSGDVGNPVSCYVNGVLETVAMVSDVTDGDSEVWCSLFESLEKWLYSKIIRIDEDEEEEELTVKGDTIIKMSGGADRLGVVFFVYVAFVI